MSLLLREVGIAGHPGLVLQVEGLHTESLFASHLYHGNGFHLIVTLLGLLVAGGILETRWGTPRFVAYYLFTAWGTTLVSLGCALVLEEKGPACGSSGVVFACLTSLGLVCSEDRLASWTPPTKHLAWILIFLGATGLALLRLDPAGYFLLPQVSGVAFALAFARIDPWCRRRIARWKARREDERRMKVVRIRLRVDELLDKISSEGYGSLSPEEKLFLRQASKHYRVE